MGAATFFLLTLLAYLGLKGRLPAYLALATIAAPTQVSNSAAKSNALPVAPPAPVSNNGQPSLIAPTTGLVDLSQVLNFGNALKGIIGSAPSQTPNAQ